MRRIILYFITATIAFTVGVAAHVGINALGAFAVEKFYNDAQMTELERTTLISNSGYVPTGAHDCSYLLITVTNNGTLYLNSEEAGTLNDTAALTAMLRGIFEIREQLHIATALQSPTYEHGQVLRAVYIRAPREMTYGDLVDLVQAVKDAGAEPIGLAADRPYRSY
ncbi:MAG: ExbD/TolR family protein [Pyrinomonadaceae bacterium]